MSSEHQSIVRKGGRWLRVGLLTYTLAAPLGNALLERVRQRSDTVRQRAQDLQKNVGGVGGVGEAQAAALARLDALTTEGRQLVSAQIQRLQEQAKELEKLSRQLRKAARKEAKLRRKYLKQLRETRNWSRKVVERGSQATKDLAKRSRKLTQELAERGDELLEPVRTQSGSSWTIFGFSLGVLTAAIVTYILIRRRMVARELEELEQQIELPQNPDFITGSDANQNKPVGEIRRVDDIGTAVVTMPVVDVEQMLHPADAKFVGIASTRLYYPVETSVDAKDLVYFISEEEAQNQGFTAAHQRDEQS